MKKIYPFFLILILSWFAVAPIFKQGFFSIHDDTQVARVFEMGKAFKDGQFPVRWVADLGYGYGYPLFNYYSPLPYYFGSFLNLLGFSVLVATKLMFLTGILLSGIFMYLLAKEFFGKLGGVLASLFYFYAPYHALDIYVRGAVGEFWAMAFLPLVFLGIVKLSETKTQSYAKILWTGLAYACLILSHNLTALIATPFLLGWIMFWATRSRRFLFIIHYSLFIILLGLSLSAFYWLPAVFEAKYIDIARLIIGKGGDYANHFVFLDQLWNWPWGFAGSAPGRADGISFKIGKLHLITAFFSLIFALIFKNRNRSNFSISQFLNFSILISVFFTLKVSHPFWQVLPFLPFLQYPWRFLTLITFFVSFVGGAVVYWVSSFAKKSSILPKNQTRDRFWAPRTELCSGAGVATVLLCFLVIFYNAKYFQPQRFYSPERDYTSFKALAWEASKLSDEYLPPGFTIPKSFAEVPQEKVVVEKGRGEITDKVTKTHLYSFKVKAEEPLSIRINTIYFPGFKAWVDGKEASLKKRGDGLMEINLPPGEHKVLIKLTNTKVRTFGNLVSFTAFVTAALSMIKLMHAKKPERKGRA